MPPFLAHVAALLSGACLLLCSVAAASQSQSLVALVDTRQGTDSHHGFSTGNTLPLTTLPHGMIAWIPQTDEGNWSFDARAATLQGFRATHQPSPWIGDYGHFELLVGSGERPPLSVVDVDSHYSKAETIAQPHYFRTYLTRHAITAEIAPTERGAHFRLTYGRDAPAWITFKPAAGRITHIDPAQRRIEGVSTAAWAGVPDGFGCYFVAEVSASIAEHAHFDTKPMPQHRDQSAVVDAAWLKLARPANGVVTIKIATSFISPEQARLNLQRELGSADFPATRSAAENAWNRRLGVVTIDGATEPQRRTFYGCLYRAFLFPRQWHEFDPAGQRVHRSPFDGRVHAGPLFTDIGLWDAHRTLFPMLSLLAPDLLAEIIEGWCNAYKEGGWLPGWSSPGYIPCMVGSHAGLVIVDAYRKGIRNFDVAAAYAAVLKDATRDSDNPAFGRTGLAGYDQLGYVAADRLDHSVARTCDYAHADFGASVFARAMNDAPLATRLARRALSYRHVYDPNVGFLRGRHADGAWRTPFREFEWNGDYIEGSAWQHTWAAPHDAAGLIALMGGEERFVVRLERMLSLPPHYEIGRYPQTIHEMSEVAAVPFGQYAHSNQPVHHVLSLFTAAGRPELAQHWTRRVLNELYGPLTFCGDEDNGSMASWFVLNALGLYPLTLGHPAWVLGSPLFERATVRIPGKPVLVIRAAGESAASTPYVQHVAVNGALHRSLELPHSALLAGGELVFTLTRDVGLARARGKLARPFSLSAEPSPTAP
jgi:predicted alpha-1,2-mannosidase